MIDAIEVGVVWFFELLEAHGIDPDRWNWAEDEGPEFLDDIIADLEAGFWIEARMIQGKLIFIRRDRLGVQCLGFIEI